MSNKVVISQITHKLTMTFIVCATNWQYDVLFQVVHMETLPATGDKETPASTEMLQYSGEGAI